jgi:N-methylhydantoinase B
MDGHHCAIFPANGANTPVEIFESDTPLRVEVREIVCDSGGPGKMRGGLGRRMVIRIPDDQYAPQPPVTVAVQAGRFRYPPQGIFGGNAGAKARFLNNDEPADPSGLTFCEPGDLLTFCSAGGGGYGDPFERDIKAVETDVMQGYVSIDHARRYYGVAIDSATQKADPAATDALRRLKKPADQGTEK